MAASAALSYVKGSTKGPIQDRAGFAYVDKWAATIPEKEALVFRPSEEERYAITFGELKTAGENLAVWFKRRFDIKKGDRVGILSLNRLAFALCEQALHRLGAVTSGLYATMDSKLELTRSLNTIEARLLLVQFGSLPSVHTILPMLDKHDPDTGRLYSEELPSLEQVVILTGERTEGCISLPNYSDINASESELKMLREEQSKITVDDDCVINSTSGSTGTPKFVVRSHAAALDLMFGICERTRVTPGYRFFVDRPMAHVSGNRQLVITHGATMVIGNPCKTVSGKQSDYVLRILEEEKINCGVTFPYVMYDLVSSGRTKSDFSKMDLKFFAFGGQVMNAGIVQTVRETMGLPLVQVYGSTEMGGVCSTSIEDPGEVCLRWSGSVLPWNEIKIVNRETGEILPRGVVGSIAVRTPHLWRYLNNEEKMRQTHDKDGYFYPGDMGSMNEEGWVEILGRDDDMITVGTVNVYPTTVEQKICQHAAVDRAIVFGVPDTRLGNVIGAVVQPKSGQALCAEDIKAFFKSSVGEQDLMTGISMAPQHVWIENSLQLTLSGKIDKASLRNKYLNELAKSKE